MIRIQEKLALTLPKGAIAIFAQKIIKKIGKGGNLSFPTFP
jgi:hypothetical protein